MGIWVPHRFPVDEQPFPLDRTYIPDLTGVSTHFPVSTPTPLLPCPETNSRSRGTGWHSLRLLKLLRFKVGPRDFVILLVSCKLNCQIIELNIKIYKSVYHTPGGNRKNGGPGCLQFPPDRWVSLSTQGGNILWTSKSRVMTQDTHGRSLLPIVVSRTVHMSFRLNLYGAPVLLRRSRRPVSFVDDIHSFLSTGPCPVPLSEIFTWSFFEVPYIVPQPDDAVF